MSGFKNFSSLLLILITISNFAVDVFGHAILTKPTSKNTANFSTPHTVTLGQYFSLASYGIIDKAFFDGDHGITPWNRPGEFDFWLAKTVVGTRQTLHPCGCNAGVDIRHCLGVHDIATGFGETNTGVSGLPAIPTTPPLWALGSIQETAWNAYANHAGGYIYMLCKKTTFDECRDTNFPDGVLAATESQTDAYLQCVWDCFESNTLEWATPATDSSQRVQYQDDECTYAETLPREKIGTDNRVWRYMPIPDTAQITNGNDGWCTWDSVLGFSNDLAQSKFIQSFGTSNVCDTGPDAHGPKNWHIIDKVQLPTDLSTGEYLLSWRWDGYMADQMWTNCADVQIVQDAPAEEDEDNQSCPPVMPITPVPQPSATPPPAPTNNGPCSDILPLPGNWGANGLYDCDYYETRDSAYCGHSEIATNCCFCGGGNTAPTTPTQQPDPPTPTQPPSTQPAPVDAPPTSGGPCSDILPLPGNWGAGGLYDCNYYEDRSSAYCNNIEIATNCCFCDGGNSGPAPTTPPPVPTTPAPVPTTPAPVPTTPAPAPTVVPTVASPTGDDDDYEEIFTDGFEDNDTNKFKNPKLREERKHGGSKSTRLKKNQALTSHEIILDTSSFVKINFFYSARNLEAGEGLSLRYKLGSDGWVEARQWILDTDFGNSNKHKNAEWYEGTETIATEGKGKIKIQFKGLNDETNDQIYIDDVTVSGSVN